MNTMRFFRFGASRRIPFVHHELVRTVRFSNVLLNLTLTPFVLISVCVCSLFLLFRCSIGSSRTLFIHLIYYASHAIWKSIEWNFRNFFKCWLFFPKQNQTKYEPNIEKTATTTEINICICSANCKVISKLSKGMQLPAVTFWNWNAKSIHIFIPFQLRLTELWRSFTYRNTHTHKHTLFTRFTSIHQMRL